MISKAWAVLRRVSYILALPGCVAVLGCSAEITPAEQEFYDRASAIKTGQTTEDVKRQIGGPTRIVDSGQLCTSSGGEKEWVYESFETPTGRVQLEGSSRVFCVTSQGVVVHAFLVHK